MINMRLVPSRKVCEEFRLIYELKGAQKAVDFLAKHYRVRSARVSTNQEIASAQISEVSCAKS